MKIAAGCAALLSLAFAVPSYAGVLEPGSAKAHRAATVSTLIRTPLTIEGLTNDRNGNLYAPGRNTTAGQPCPVYRTSIDNPSLAIVGLVPAPSATGTCSPSGLAFGEDGRLYVTQTDRIYRFTPSSASPPTADLFASNVPGTNGLAFDRDGNLWTGDGTTGQGRVWKIDGAGVATEMFRIPPMANAAGVGRSAVTLPPGTAQPLVANGLQFTRRGDLLVADTARGAIWYVQLDGNGEVASNMGCDTTFNPKTLCLDNVWVAHPIMEGIDGIVLDLAGGVWGVANERNAIFYVYPNGQVAEVYRNAPDAATQLRNAGPLESPASPVLVNNRFCTSNSDGNRRDNSPPAAGEIGAPGQDRGKIACIDQQVTVDGISLPIR
jgi:sugar lactone lactonase YvrE